MRTLTRKWPLALAAAGALAFAGACKEATSVPDLNNLSDAVIAGGLNASTTQLLVTGLFNRDRDIAGFRYYVFSGTLQRDIYNIDPSEDRFITELLGTAIDPGGFTGGSGGFTESFNAVRTANIILEKIGTASDLGADGQAGVRGIARTMKALALYRALELRGPNGIPVDNSPVTAGQGELSPIRCEPAALASISAILDSGFADLQAANDFPVELPAGFSSNGEFNTPEGFAKFNRGLKGRAELYRGLLGGGAAAFTSAVAALNASFLDVNAPTTNGVYFTFSTAPGETRNPIAEGTIYLNPTVGTGIQAGDQRAAKIITVARQTRRGVTTNIASPVTNPTNLTGPLPILRNAELILLRAQAEIELGLLGPATDDINVVRTKEGGLAPLAPLTSRDAAVQAVLYEKRYSLLLQGPQRLVDLRAYGLFTPAYLAGTGPATGDTFQSALPIPRAESDARGGASAVACQ